MIHSEDHRNTQDVQTFHMMVVVPVLVPNIYHWYNKFHQLENHSNLHHKCWNFHYHRSLNKSNHQDHCKIRLCKNPSRPTQDMKS